MTRVKTIDAEVAGEPVRLIVEGGPSVPGRTMAEKRAWLRRHGDDLRRFLMLEPRGHAGMHGALFTEPVSAGAHAGVLSMHAAGWPAISGEGVVAAITIGLDHGLLQGASDELSIDTPAGLLRARPRRGASDDAGVSSVWLTGLESYVHSAGLIAHVGSRKVAVDIAFGGAFYAIADSEAIGVPIDMAHAAALVDMGRVITGAVARTIAVEGTIFTGAPRADAHLRSATVLEGGVLRRSPGMTGTAALLAVLDAMGLVAGDQPLVHEGILGTVMQARVVSRQQHGERASVTSVIEGTARVTGLHEFVGS